ncbi:MAG: sigma-54-dependent Fis family transcriptional regulator [Deltaproteobacteria bacterium]|nr:sigma-54-dependent Fis family transcriptional regulator [Deltaproteobacteria bacterium]
MNKKSILIVDDEEIVRYSLVNILGSHGYETTDVASGAEALRILYERTYNLVLTDLVMEGMDGLELVEHIKVISPKTVVLVLTGYGSIKTAISALRLGVYDYLLKPCDEDELLIRIRRALEMQHYGEEQKRLQELAAIAKTAVTLSDQINTPLNIILGNIEMLQLSQEFSSASKAQKALEVMEKQIFEIKDVMEKLARLTTAETIKYTSLTDYEMIDLSGGNKNGEK